MALSGLRLLLFLLAWLPLNAMASNTPLDIHQHWLGPLALLIFFLAYVLVISAEIIQLHKSKPVILAAGLIWILIAWASQDLGPSTEVVNQALRHSLLNYTELMLFLLVSMTYINALHERRVFSALRTWMISQGMGYRHLYWLTGLLTFCLSPLADNLTTALVMSTVVISLGKDNRHFLLLSCIHIVVAANAGGVFSPFGDITTLMVWQRDLQTPQGPMGLSSFLHLFLPALVGWLIPALLMHFSLSDQRPVGGIQPISMLRGARRIMLLFLLTIVTAALLDSLLKLPPVLGMMTGLAYLQLFGYYLKVTREEEYPGDDEERMGGPVPLEPKAHQPFDIFHQISRAEWDTLLFFYGLVLCIGGLGFLGYLGQASEIMYLGWGTTQANIALGVFSGFIDNIAVMFSVLYMEPTMSLGQWLLITLTTGLGGSLLSIGSTAGVALMAQARGIYTFGGHLRWAPAIALGYVSSILCHLWLNGDLF
jgi:Na+/H+ antiporter NhaD/arsenite permease-like protein